MLQEEKKQDRLRDDIFDDTTENNTRTVLYVYSAVCTKKRCNIMMMENLEQDGYLLLSIPNSLKGDEGVNMTGNLILTNKYITVWIFKAQRIQIKWVRMKFYLDVIRIQ